MANQNIKLNINHDGKTVKSLNIPAGTNGQAVHVSAQDNVTYQFIDDNTHLAPQDIVAKRNGENLVISFKGGNLNHPDLIIDNYYSPNIHTSANNLLLGEGNHSSFYIPPASDSDTLGLVAEEVQNTASTTEASLLQQTVHSGFGLFAGMVAVGTAESIYLAHMSEKGHVVHHDTPPVSSVTPPPVVPVTPSVTHPVAPANPAHNSHISGSHVSPSAGSTTVTPPIAPVTPPHNTGTTATSPTVSPPVTPPKEADYTLEVDTNNNNYKKLTIHDNGHIDFSKFAHQNISEITLDNDALPQHIHITPEEVALIAPKIQLYHSHEPPLPWIYISSKDANDTIDLGEYIHDPKEDTFMNLYIDKSNQFKIKLDVSTELLPVPQDKPYYIRDGGEVLTLNQQVDFDKIASNYYKENPDSWIQAINMGDNGVGEHITISGKNLLHLCKAVTDTNGAVFRVYSADNNDTVTIDGLIRDETRDIEKNHIHYDAYVSPIGGIYDHLNRYNHYIGSKSVVTAYVQHGLVDNVIPPHKDPPNYTYSNHGELFIHDNTPVDFSHLYAVNEIVLDNNSVTQTLKTSIHELADIMIAEQRGDAEMNNLLITSHDLNDRVIIDGLDTLPAPTRGTYHLLSSDGYIQNRLHYIYHIGDVDYNFYIDSNLIKPVPPNDTYTVSDLDTGNHGITLYGKDPNLDFSQLHRIDTINMGNNGVIQHLTLTNSDITSLTTKEKGRLLNLNLVIYSQDKGDTVTLKGMEADPNGDRYEDHIHYQRYIDSVDHSAVVYVQEGLIA